MKTLGFSIKTTVEHSPTSSWAKMTGRIYSANRRSLRQRPVPIPTHSLCTLLPTRKNLAHCSGLPGPKGVYRIAGCDDSLVHITGRNIPAPYLDAAKKEGVGAGV
jgi:hypothetical protein